MARARRPRLLARVLEGLLFQGVRGVRGRGGAFGGVAISAGEPVWTDSCRMVRRASPSFQRRGRRARAGALGDGDAPSPAAFGPVPSDALEPAGDSVGARAHSRAGRSGRAPGRAGLGPGAPRPPGLPRSEAPAPAGLSGKGAGHRRPRACRTVVFGLDAGRRVPRTRAGTRLENSPRSRRDAPGRARIPFGDRPGSARRSARSSTTRRACSRPFAARTVLR